MEVPVIEAGEVAGSTCKLRNLRVIYIRCYDKLENCNMESSFPDNFTGPQVNNSCG